MRTLAMSLFGGTLAIASSLAQAHPGAGVTGPAFDPHPGGAVPAALAFRDETGRTVELAGGAKPIVLVLGYARCRDLCGVTLVGADEALRHAGMQAGRDYAGIFASIDPDDDPARLAQAKAQRLPPDERAGWRFLQGQGDAVPRLAAAVGFAYRREPDGVGFAHPAGFVVLTPDAHVARYFEGVRFDPPAVREAIAAAAQGRSVGLGERLRLLCSHLDPTTGRHTATILVILRLLVFAGFWGLVLWMWRARRRNGSGA